ncbi:MAG: 30S ribosomal protein S4 [Candidatus ainarchaeum sp.]|nr:30S ribosomal protein S4 [Candidatus ainarchaeum sp.]
MGDPKKRKRMYSKPRKSFQKERMVKEKQLKELYGLKNKKEFYRAETIIRAKRATARKLLALNLQTRLKRESELLTSLKKIGILTKTPTLDDVLTLNVESILERRLQTIVWRKGLANTTKQARQFITHGHIAINGKKVNIPSYIVTFDEENNINYYGKELQVELKKHIKIKTETKNTLKDKFEEIKEAINEEEDANKKPKDKITKENIPQKKEIMNESKVIK